MLKNKYPCLFPIFTLTMLTLFWPNTHAANSSQGFADFSYDRTEQAVLDTYKTIIDNSDIIVYHHDNGVPWNEALLGLPYGESIQS